MDCLDCLRVYFFTDIRLTLFSYTQCRNICLIYFASQNPLRDDKEHLRTLSVDHITRSQLQHYIRDYGSISYKAILVGIQTFKTLHTRIYSPDKLIHLN